MTTPQSHWPLQRDCDTFYGNPRGRNASNPSVAFESKYIVNLTPPFQLYYGDKAVKTIRVHVKCKDAFERVFLNLKEAAGGDYKTLQHWGVTKYGGAYNYRLMRGGNSLSMHSWGCAIDLDPANNGMYDKTPRFAQFPAVLKAFADEGAIWGGDWNGNHNTQDERSCDGMHWQFARLK